MVSIFFYWFLSLYTINMHDLTCSLQPSSISFPSKYVVEWIKEQKMHLCVPWSNIQSDVRCLLDGS